MTGPVTGTVPAPRLRVQVVATRAAGRFLSEIVQTYLVEGLGLGPEQPETVQVRLAVVEAVTNVIRHAYPAGSPGTVTIEMERASDALVTTITDTGIRFDPFLTGKDLPRPEELREGGYGIGIIHKVMEDVRYFHDTARGNRLRLRKKLWT